jgi:hypothetical protein
MININILLTHAWVYPCGAVSIDFSIEHFLCMSSPSHTVRSESRCALIVRYVDLIQACIDARGHQFQHLL